MNISRLIALFIVFISACSEQPPPRPVVEVVADTASVSPFKPGASFIGRLEAQDDVNIQAKVTGYLKRMDFHEGDIVNAGDLLYQIDPVQFEAELAKAKADVAKAKANVKVSERNFKRGKELVVKGAISESEMDELTARKLEAEAEMASTQAQLKSAEVNLGYTAITAPINGRIGRSEHSVGDLIGPDSGTLTTLVSLDPMKASFQVSETAFLAAEKSRMTENDKINDLIVKIELSNRELYPLSGKIDYIANRIDEATGTIEARASIPNPKGTLRPGQYVKVLVEIPTVIEAVMISQAAVQADQQGSYVYTVGADSTIVRKNVVLGDRVDDKVVVQQGVEEGERVVVRGLQQVRPGQPVTVRALPVSDQAAE